MKKREVLGQQTVHPRPILKENIFVYSTNPILSQISFEQ